MKRDRTGRRPWHRRAYVPGLWFLAAALLAVVHVQPAEAVIALQDVPPSVSSVEGVVEVSSDGGDTWTPAEPGTRVSSQHLLRTGDDGTCVLAFSDYTVVALQPQTTVTMLPPDRQLRLELVAGWIWVQFDALQPGNRDSVLAPRALAAATGPSTFTMEFDGDGGTIKVIDGDVDVRSDSGAFLTALADGESVIITPSASTIPFEFNVEAEQAAWEPVFAGLSTTTLPDETTTTGTAATRSTVARTTSTLEGGTTRTSQPPDDPGSGGATRLGIALVLGAAALFVALLAASTVLAVLLIRRTKPPNTVGGPPAYPPATGPARTDRPRAEAPPGFCRSCGAPLSHGGQFCRACGKRTDS